MVISILFCKCLYFNGKYSYFIPLGFCWFRLNPYICV
nr:MAG TPA: hypothetical protein [Caudoviricetes sp.]DAX76846.1 MAG TPA: hypothetical protein [Caudoviricetes sp.]